MTDQINGDARRLMSLVPAATDMVVALGLTERLLGVSHACDHPAVAERPRVSRTRVPTGSAAEIDAWVSAAARAGEALHVLDEALLDELDPDLILAQVVCDVCALDGRDMHAIQKSGRAWLNLDGASWEGLKADCRAIAAACGVPARAEGLIDNWEARLPIIPTTLPRPRVLAIEWDEPLFLGGHWVPEWIAHAGGTHLLVPPHHVSPRATWDEVLVADADILLVMPCGYDLASAWDATRRLMQSSPLKHTRAARQGQLWALDANRLFSRIGPTSIVAIETLAGILHPERFRAPSPDTARQWR